jgi:hypothetical protein
VTTRLIVEMKNKLTYQFVRISVEIARDVMRFGRPVVGTFAPRLKPSAVEHEKTQTTVR